MNDSWKMNFRKIILDRGEDYYYEGNVSKLEKTGYGYHAIVSGSTDYDVEIYMEDGNISDMECDCPYAQDDNHCKHEAAVLYAIFEDETGFKSKDLSKPRESMEEILASMSEKQIREELYRILKEEPLQYDRIYNTYRKKKADKADIRRILSKLDHLAYEYGDRGGFIDWRNSMDYANAFTGYLDDSLSPMIQRGEYKEAFEVMKGAYQIVENVEMDGSSGEHSVILSEIDEKMEQVIHLCDEGLKDEIHEWIEGLLSDEYRMIYDDAYRLYCYAFDDEKYLVKLLEQVKEKIEDLNIGRYRLEESLELYEDVLKRLGYDDEEYKRWLFDHYDLTAVKNVCLKKAREADDLDGQLKILIDLSEGEETSRFRIDHLRQIAAIYEKKGDTEKLRDTLIQIAAEDRYCDEGLFDRIRLLCDQSEWEPLREKLLEDHQNLAPAVYAKEGLFGKIAEHLQEYPIDIAFKYFKALKDDHPEVLLKRLFDHMYVLEKRSPCASLYEEEKKVLSKILLIEGGKEKLVSFMEEWRNKYPTRKAMYRMFDEIEGEM